VVCFTNLLVRYANVVVSSPYVVVIWLWLALALDHQRKNLDHEGQDMQLLELLVLLDMDNRLIHPSAYSVAGYVIG